MPGPIAGPHEREHPGAAHRGRPEPETPPGGNWLEAAPRPVGEPDGPAQGARAALGRLGVVISSTATRTRPVSQTRDHSHEWWSRMAIFQRPEPCEDLEPPSSMCQAFVTRWVRHTLE